MSKFRFVLYAVLLIIVGTMPVSLILAEEVGAGNYISNPDSWQLDTSNFCDEGGVWGPAFCNNDDMAPSNWKYEFGWWWQRVIEGDISPCIVPELYGGGCDVVSKDGNSITIQTPAGSITITFVLAGPSGTDIHPGAPASPNHTLNQDNFDAPTEGAGLGINQTDNLVIYGNSANNTITGWDGDDTIYGGDESCTGNNCNAGGTLGDDIDGGVGNDTLHGGDESCTGDSCTEGGFIGDILQGGDGDDVIDGGDESCTGDSCNSNFGFIGDSIEGGDGDDNIAGGDESCDGQDCNDSAIIGDQIFGEDGADTVDGGDESCTGTDCNAGGFVLGDRINQNDIGNTDDGDADNIDGGTENNGGSGGPTGDTCQASSGDTTSGC